jgi:hypothetical protein
LYEELAGGERQEVQDHLSSCGDCQQELAALSRTLQVLDKDAAWSVRSDALGRRSDLPCK